LQTTPPPIPPNFKIGLLEAHMLELQNTVAVNFADNPAVALPIPPSRACNRSGRGWARRNSSTRAGW